MFLCGPDRQGGQLCTITQNSANVDIYFSSPNFVDIDWLSIVESENNLELRTFGVDSDGKLSIHRSGIAHVRQHDNQQDKDYRIVGSELGSREGDSLGVRHLLTIYPAEPQHKPASGVGGRASDEVLNATEWAPHALIFWAIPFTQDVSGLKVEGSFSVDDLHDGPPKMGFGMFALEKHIIFWIAYRTLHMDRWPRKSIACYLDGYHVPMFIGTGVGQYRLEIKQPNYRMNGGVVEIAF